MASKASGQKDIMHVVRGVVTSVPQPISSASSPKETPGQVPTPSPVATMAAHPLLGTRCPLPDGGLLFTARLALDDHPWLADHTVYGSALMPAAGLIELADCLAGSSVTKLVEFGGPSKAA